MNTGQIFGQLNWLDGAVALIILAHIAAGMGRGFMMGALDLAGMALSLAAGIAGYRPAADLIVQFVHMPRAVAILAAFIGTVMLAQLLFSMVVNVFFRVLRPVVPTLGHLPLADRLFGAMPGAVKGIVFSTLILLPFTLFPIVPQLSAGIERSAIASQLVIRAVETAPSLEAVMGRDLNEGLSFLTPPQTEEGMKINFGILGKLTPDPAAEEKMLQLVNEERQKAGLQPLQMDEDLRQVARAHSQEMFEMGYFAHDSPVSGTPFDRMRAAGISFEVAGENLAYAPNVDIAHEGLMNSPGHRANILRGEFGKVGIGVIKSEYRGSMFSQEFTNR